MKRTNLMLLLMCVCTLATAQHASDTADVFYNHLRLGEVVIQGVAGETRMKDASAPVSLVTNKEMRQTAATNIIDAVAKQPGVAQITTGSGISKPVIRGLGYNRIVVVSDGIRQEGQQWGDEHGIEVDAQSVNAVEILKGPASLMYGSDAMAGVMVFRNAPSLQKGELSGEISTEYQTNNGLLGYSVNMGGNHDGWLWDARYSGKMAHAYKNNADGYVPGSQFREQSLHGMFGRNTSWGHSHLRLGYYHLTPGIIEGERNGETGELVYDGNNVKTYGTTLPFQQIYHYKAVFDNSIAIPVGQLKAIFGYQQNKRQEFEEDFSTPSLYFQLHTLTYDLHYLSNSWQGWKLNAGINGMYQRSLNKGEELLIPAYQLLDFGIYATANKKLADWVLNGGIRWDMRQLHSEGMTDKDELRFEDFSRHFNGLTGSMGATWHISPLLTMRMNLSRGFRAPNLSELASNGIHEGSIRYEIGNQHLKAEQSLQADWGLDFASEYVTAQVALFANRINNYVFARRLDEIVEEGYKTYLYDSGNAQLLGLEAGADVHPVHRIHFGTTFSYVNAVQRHQPRETKYLPMTPAPRWTADIKYEITHNGRHFNNAFVALGMECNLRQSHYYMVDETETATPSYTLFNINAGTDLVWNSKKRAELYLTADNLTNRVYQNHLNRLKYADDNVITGRKGVFNMGRNVVVKLIIPVIL